jgi:glyoxylase-like metal-dependent hydrolase (beta-lactamase superfamily II)
LITLPLDGSKTRIQTLVTYLDSLRKTQEMPAEIVFGGHGEPITDPAARAREVLAHHAARLDETAAALGSEPRSGYEVSLSLFGDELAPSQRRFAVAEALAHIEHLVTRGRARKRESDGGFSYTET